MWKPGSEELRLSRNSVGLTRPFWMLRGVPSWNLKTKPSRICSDSWEHTSSRRWCLLFYKMDEGQWRLLCISDSFLIIIFSLHSVVLAAKLHRCSCAANVLPPLRWICKWLRSTKGKGGSRWWRDHSRQLFFHSQHVSRSVCKIMSSFIKFQAAQNLVVLSREDAGAEQIFRNDGVKLIQRLLQSKQEDVVLSALRTLVGLCTGHQSRVS